jgi:cytochrome c-type biogenesis protein
MRWRRSVARSARSWRSWQQTFRPGHRSPVWGRSSRTPPALALARTVLVDRLRRAAAVTTRLGGLVLLLAGGYLAYYGSYEIRVLHDGTAIDPVVEGAVAAQRWLAGGVDRIGASGMAAGLALLLAAGLVTGWVNRRTHRSTDGT